MVKVNWLYQILTFLFLTSRGTGSMRENLAYLRDFYCLWNYTREKIQPKFHESLESFHCNLNIIAESWKEFFFKFLKIKIRFIFKNKRDYLWDMSRPNELVLASCIHVFFHSQDFKLRLRQTRAKKFFISFVQRIKIIKRRKFLSLRFLQGP